MRRFRNILVVFDRASGSLAALERAGELAVDSGARLAIAVCLSEFEDVNIPAPLRQAVLDGVRGHFANAAQPFRDLGVPIDVRVCTGRPFVQVIRDVLRHGHDLVMKTAEGGLRADQSFGSTDLHLLRKCPAPVWILAERREAAAAPVLAAVAPHAPGTEHERLNARIVDLATALAARSGGAVHVVQAWTPPDDTLMRLLRPGTVKGALEARLDDARRNLEARFVAFVERARKATPWVNAHFVEEAPERAIGRLCDETQPAAIVMGTITAAGTPGLLIGRTAETVLRQARCSVVALKPEGFQTPVAP